MNEDKITLHWYCKPWRRKLASYIYRIIQRTGVKVQKYKDRCTKYEQSKME